jgi:NAD(P)-dependent dehydrogenase (short-subunit alcohol dehydrogenase family)
MMAGCENIIKAAINNYGRIDILVGCAGNFKKNQIDEMTEEDWDSLMTVHAKGLFGCVRYAAPYMKKQKSGSIITISSVAVFSNSARSPAYSAGKAAVLGLTWCLAVQLGQYGITVNCLVPSAPTQLFPGKGDGTAGAEKYLGLPGIPNPKIAGPDMIAPFAVYLTTNEARNINGQVFWVSGPYVSLLSAPRPVTTICGTDKWTVDELIDIVPVTMGLKMVNPVQTLPPPPPTNVDTKR